MAVTRTKPHSLSIFLRNPHDLGNKTVNPLLTASVAQQGRLHITPDERRDAGRLYHSGRASRSRALCQPDSKLFYASGALIFHTVSSHDSPFPQRKIARDEKKRTPCDRLVHCAAEFRLQAGGGVCMFESLREILAGKTRPEEQQLVYKEYSGVQCLFTSLKNIWN